MTILRRTVSALAISGLLVGTTAAPANSYVAAVEAVAVAMLGTAFLFTSGAALETNKNAFKMDFDVGGTIYEGVTALNPQNILYAMKVCEVNGSCAEQIKNSISAEIGAVQAASLSQAMTLINAVSGTIAPSTVEASTVGLVPQYESLRDFNSDGVATTIYWRPGVEGSRQELHPNSFLGASSGTISSSQTGSELLYGTPDLLVFYRSWFWGGVYASVQKNCSYFLDGASWAGGSYTKGRYTDRSTLDTLGHNSDYLTCTIPLSAIPDGELLNLLEDDPARAGYKMLPPVGTTAWSSFSEALAERWTNTTTQKPLEALALLQSAVPDVPLFEPVVAPAETEDPAATILLPADYDFATSSYRDGSFSAGTVIYGTGEVVTSSTTNNTTTNTTTTNNTSSASTGLTSVDMALAVQSGVSAAIAGGISINNLPDPGPDNSSTWDLVAPITDGVGLPIIGEGSKWLPDQCPAPVEFPIFGHSIYLSWQFVCDYAWFFKILTMITAAWSALMVLAGARRG